MLLYLAAHFAGASTVTLDCTTGDAPSAFSSLTESCKAAGTNNVCADYEPEGSVEILCDAAADGTGYGATMYAVHYGSRDYSIWGYAGNGQPFCCSFAESEIGEVTLLQLTGTEFSDTLRFNKDSGTYNLENPGGTELFAAEIFGLSGADNIDGAYSYDGRAGFTQVLWGGGDNDVLRLHGLVRGNLHGEGGADTLIGSDYSPGGFDLGDNLVGDEDEGSTSADDVISGGAGADVLDGKGGADSLCGDEGADVLWGGAGPDDLWGGLGTDHGDGGAGIDSCSVEVPTSCAVPLSAHPSACP